MKISKLNKKLLLLSASSLFLAQNALAICPVCTIAVGAGVGLAEYLGIDDLITGLWIGALTLLLVQWTIEWVRKIKIHIKGMPIIVFLLVYLLIIWPLYSMKIIGAETNQILGIDKLVFGMIIGTGILFSTQKWYEEIKENNKGRAQFPFQKVIIPIVSLLILSVIFYFLINL